MSEQEGKYEVKPVPEIDWKALSSCFPAKDIEWRLQECGKKKDGSIWAMCLAYITNRAIMQRLDDVCGPANWRNEYAPGPHGGIICGLSIRCGNEWVTKWDGADNTQVEAVKGGLSDAMKRAGVQWGIGRYLYNLESGWAEITEKGENRGKTKDGDYFKWNPPKLPSWALPGAAPKEPAKKKAQEPKPTDTQDKLTPEQFASKWERMNPDTLQAWTDKYWPVVEQNFMGDTAGLAKVTEYLDDRWKELKKGEEGNG